MKVPDMYPWQGFGRGAFDLVGTPSSTRVETYPRVDWGRWAVDAGLASMGWSSMSMGHHLGGNTG